MAVCALDGLLRALVCTLDGFLRAFVCALDGLLRALVCALDGLLRALVRSLGDWRSLFEGAGAEVDLLREPPDKTPSKGTSRIKERHEQKSVTKHRLVRT